MLLLAIIFYCFEIVVIFNEYYYITILCTFLECIISIVQCDQFDFMMCCRMIIDLTMMAHCSVLKASKQYGWNDSHLVWTYKQINYGNFFKFCAIVNLI